MASHKINPCYHATTLAQQTARQRPPKMQRMEVERTREEENKEMTEMNIKEFMEAAYKYMFGMTPVRQPVLATIRVRQVR